MSREVPLLASEKIALFKLVFWLAIIVVAILVGVITGIINNSKKDPDAFKEDYAKICEYYQIQRFNYTEEEFNIDLLPSVWESMSHEGKRDYCNRIIDNTKKLLWKYYIFSEPAAPDFKFYSNTVCARTAGSKLEIP